MLIHISILVKKVIDSGSLLVLNSPIERENVRDSMK